MTSWCSLFIIDDARMRASMQRLLKSIRGPVHFLSRYSRRWRRAWKVRALTAVTVKPSRRAVSAFDSPWSSRSRATVRKFFRSREMAVGDDGATFFFGEGLFRGWAVVGQIDR